MQRLAPHLCVVGHPNKGKSSMVSTLVEDDTVQVGLESGTTRQADSFYFKWHGKTLLQLTDTPGFQRPRQVLDWLTSVAVNPAQRPARIKEFLAEPTHAARFPDEVALLTPIMAGAGILYVVDAAQPVTAADEAEMEILRWTGQPRMAVINPMTVGGERTEWLGTLEQYFQWVRVFNPLTADLPARLTLLRAIGELRLGWSDAMAELCAGLEQRQQQRLEDVSIRLAQYWCEQMDRREPMHALHRASGLKAEEILRQKLDDAERQWFHSLLDLWHFQSTEVDRMADWELDAHNLMRTETWYLWGLKQKDLLLASAAAGAAAGLAIDVGLGGASLLLGAVSGGVVGSASGWLATKQKPGQRWGLFRFSQEKTFIGPVKHPNFPLVVMSRALSFVQQLWVKPHAERSAFTLHNTAEQWDRSAQIQLLKWAKTLQNGHWKSHHQMALAEWIQSQLSARLERFIAAERDRTWLT